MAALIELLVKLQLLDDRQHDAVESRARSPAGGHVIQQIAELGYATESAVARALSVELGLPRVDLALTPPEPQVLLLLDGRTCADKFMLPVALREEGELLWLAMADPTDEEAIGLARRKSQKRIRPAVAGPTEIQRAIRLFYSSPQPRPVEVAEVEEEHPLDVVNVAESIADEDALSRVASQLGVAVPENVPSRRITGKRLEVEVDVEPTPPPITRPLPAPAGKKPPIRVATLEELLAPAAQGPAGTDDLTSADLASIDALRSSMEKGALVLRTIAELCVEKGVLSPDEMKRKNRGD